MIDEKSLINHKLYTPHYKMSGHPKSDLFMFLDSIGSKDRPVSTYEETKIPPNQMNFRCTGSVAINGRTYQAISGQCSTKKIAERDAFQNLMDSAEFKGLMTSKSLASIDAKSIDSKRTTIDASFVDSLDSKSNLIIIDYDNFSIKSEIEKLTQWITSNPTFRMLKISGLLGSDPVKADSNIVVPSTRKDAVDHYIGYLVGLVQHKNPKIYIITRDHFAGALQDFCDNVKHVINVDDFVALMKTSNETLENLSNAPVN